MLLATVTPLLTTLPTAAAERATYVSGGKLTLLVHGGVALEVQGNFLVCFDGELDVPLQPHDQKSPITRDGLALRWHGTTAFPNGGSAQFAVNCAESDTGTAMDATVTNASNQPLDVRTIDYVIDVPRAGAAGLAIASDQPDVLISGFRTDGAMVVHMLNIESGARRIDERTTDGRVACGCHDRTRAVPGRFAPG